MQQHQDNSLLSPSSHQKQQDQRHEHKQQTLMPQQQVTPPRRGNNNTNRHTSAPYSNAGRYRGHNNIDNTRHASAPYAESTPAKTREQALKDRVHNNYNYNNHINNPNNHSNTNHFGGAFGNVNAALDTHPPKSDAFPERYTLCGFLDVRTKRSRSWKRRYFVLSNNFLLCASTQFAPKLERVTPLEGSSIVATGDDDANHYHSHHHHNHHNNHTPSSKNTDHSSSVSSFRSSNSTSNSSSNSSESDNKDSSDSKSSQDNDNSSRISSISSISNSTSASASISKSSSTSHHNHNHNHRHYHHSHSSRKKEDADRRFTLKLRTEKLLYFRAQDADLCSKWSNYIDRASRLKIKDIYRFLYTLGTSESQMTKVVSAKHILTGEDCAIKIVDKRTCDKQMLQTEVKILKKLDNQYIVQLYDLFETKKFLYIVMEKCEGGELFDQIADLDGDHYGETECCRVMYQIAQGVKYMHSQGIVHRDLKPENILCVQPKSIRRVKIADFGISKMVSPDSIQNATFLTMAGTLNYTAPEILRGKRYNTAVDCWSIGVIMYILLLGYAPFYGESDTLLQGDILSNQPLYDKEDWEHVSEDSRKLVFGLLDKDPTKRSGLDEIIKLAWVKISKAAAANDKKSSKFKLQFRKFLKDRKNNRLLSAPYTTNSTSNTGNKNTKNNINHSNIHRSGNDSVMQLTLPLRDRDSLITSYSKNNGNSPNNNSNSGDGNGN